MDDPIAGVETVGGAADDTVVEKGEDRATDSHEVQPDYQALYEKEHARAENYKTAFSQKKEFVRAGVAEPIVGDDDDDAPVTKKDLARIIQSAVTPAITSNKVEATLNELVKDPEKRKAVEIYYRNRVVQTGTNDEAIRSDIQDAIDLVDSKVNKTKAEEMARVAAQPKTPPLAGSGADSAPATVAHKFSADQVKQLTATAQRIGADPKTFIAKAWEQSKRG